jgi:hypothetical protein
MAMVRQEAEYGEMLKEVGSEREKIQKLNEKGFSDNMAKEYLGKSKEMEDNKKRLDEMQKSSNRNLSEEAKLQDKINQAMVDKADIAAAANDKTAMMMYNVKKMGEASGKPITITSKNQDLTKLGLSFDKMADAAGLEGDQRKAMADQYEAAVKENKEVTFADFGRRKTLQDQNLKQQEDNFNNAMNRFSEGLWSGLKSTLQYYVPFLKGWKGELLIGLAALAAVMVGTGKLFQVAMGLMGRKMQPHIKEGTRQGIIAAGGLGGRGGSGGDFLLGGEDRKQLPGKTGKPTGRERAKSGWRALKSGGGGKTRMGRLWGRTKGLGNIIRGGTGALLTGAIAMQTGSSMGETEAEMYHGGVSGSGEGFAGGASNQSGGHTSSTILGADGKPAHIPATGAGTAGGGRWARSKDWMKAKGTAFGGKLKSFGSRMGGGLKNFAKGAREFKGMSKAGAALKGGLGLALKGGRGGMSLLKGGVKMLKGARAIPLLGTILGAGFAIAAAWEIYSKWKKDPKSVTASDKMRMVMALAAMVPGIGAAVAAADIAMEVGGGYDKLDQVTAGSGGGATAIAGMPTPTVPGGTGMPTASSVAGAANMTAAAAGAVSGAAGVGAGGGTGGGGGGVKIASMQGKAGTNSLRGDGSAEFETTVKFVVTDMMALIAQANKNMGLNKA